MNEYHKNYYLKNNKKHEEKEYVKEFLRVSGKGGKYLTKKGFNEISKLSSASIIKGVNLSWKELLVKYNKIDCLTNYILDEYKKHAYINGKANSTAFVKEHSYLGQYIFTSIINIKAIRKMAGFINDNYSGQYNDYLLRKHFIEVKVKLERIPTVSEFLENGIILPSIYCDYYGIKGQKWDSVLKIMIEDKTDLNNFFHTRELKYRNIAVESIKNYKKESRIPEATLEEEYRRIFDFFYENFGTHPTRRLFNKHSIFNDMTYRKRFNLKWSEIAKFYGYTLKERNVTEKIFLETLKKILKCNYKRNETFSWLLGIRGKHLFYDGYFESENLIVEFDGKQHRTPVPNFGGIERFTRDQQNDAIKEKLVKAKGYKFLRVSSKEKWGDVKYLKKILKEIDIITDSE